MERLGFASRLWMALTLPWRVLGSGALAAQIRGLDARPALPGPASSPPPEATPAAAPASASPRPPAVTDAEAVPDSTAALQILAILQREGRLLDFLEEEIAGYSDAEIGAAARVVHEGCRRGLADYVEVDAIRTGEHEGDAVTLEPGYDASSNRVTGNVIGEPPFRGTLAHHGWRVSKIQMPKLAPGHDPRIVAPAEIELP